jgi:phospholipid/cholesterol/gamma-HCH transport system permease protein
MSPSASSEARVSLAREPDGSLQVRLSGRWALAAAVPSGAPLAAAIAAEPAPARLSLVADGLEEWDSTLVAFAHAAETLARERGVAVDASSLPPGARRLLALAAAVPSRVEPPPPEDDALSARVGRIALRAWGTATDGIAFVGETALALAAVARGEASFRRVDLLHALETTGVGALGIVALINFLIGAVLAFVGAVQLSPFGAAIYVANLVAIAVARELGPLMTGIVMAGRSGAAFAAALGTMTVNEEVDALRTSGLRPSEFLVAPRVLATSLMLPALVAYADLLGLMGGMFVGVTMLKIGALEYARQTQEALELRHVWIGLGKSVAFGAIVALTGCYYGVRCGRSAVAVGAAATKAVVTGIVLVVVADAAATLLLYLVGL